MHLRSKNFAERFLSLLDKYKVKTKNIRLEITEGALLENPEQVHSFNIAGINRNIKKINRIQYPAQWVLPTNEGFKTNGFSVM